jgi:flagellar biosynthetic protein FliP
MMPPPLHRSSLSERPFRTRIRLKQRILVILLLAFISLSFFPQETVVPLPSLQFGIGVSEDPSDLVVTIEILLLITILVLAPAIIMMVTSFTRIVVVFSMLRNALGTRTAPPNQVIVALSLFLTFFIMEPQITEIWNQGMVPYMNQEIAYEEMFDRIGTTMKRFMVQQLKIHRNEDNVDMLLANTGRAPVAEIDDADLAIIIPAFIIGELEIAFKMGILLFVPFILIDMLTASILLAMGMIMIPPVLISMPFKLLLFVMINGWDILVGGLLRSF